MTFWTLFGALVKIILAFLAFKLCKFLYSHFNLVRRFSKLEEQGVTIYPGASDLMGNLPTIVNAAKGIKASAEVLKPLPVKVLEDLAKKQGQDTFDGARHPVVLMNLMGTIQMQISEPETI